MIARSFPDKARRWPSRADRRGGRTILHRHIEPLAIREGRGRRRGAHEQEGEPVDRIRDFPLLVAVTAVVDRDAVEIPVVPELTGRARYEEVRGWLGQVPGFKGEASDEVHRRDE